MIIPVSHLYKLSIEADEELDIRNFRKNFLDESMNYF